MKLFRKIDTQTGNFVEDCLFEAQPVLEDGELDPQYIEEAPKQGFYWPKWNGESWEEGATQEYIDSLKAEPQEPTETERIEALEQALLEIVLGGVF